MNLYQDDIITALATPVGEGAISVIRVSGTGSIKSIDKIFVGKAKLEDAATHTVHYGKIVDGNGRIIDDVLISVFKNPKSYTGEDSVEISTHSSSIVVKKIIEELVKNKVRLAEPGEFTRRAFLNGKIDLAQAEAVADIINSRTEASLRGARNQLDGILSKKIDALREMLINSSSLIELELDFAEEDLEFLPTKEILDRINKIIIEIDKLLETYSFGRVIRDGINVAIVGKPNVGKSSLLNYILKESRAIVSEIPGTTRDIIREEVSIDGVLFKLYDTAGIRLTENDVEKEGVLRSRNAVENADLIIFLNDVIEGYSVDLYNELLELTSKERIIKVVNKIDLRDDRSISSDSYISAITGSGISDLLDILKEKGIGSQSYSEKSAVISNVRHYNALKEAKSSLVHAKNSIEDKLSGEFVAVDLRNAENFLGEIIGKVTTDDILNNIFSKFCIGK
ncbi:MAG: tRNA uridine-5-carboxymethylaminomethyl(34) synthesis GTPase MnmE [Melioribacteraceae bacterium]|nr:tRNA uridine-5-carboxymethylaminomethyl(34) synthesis GTPase MnmE [Melioribacteraceae bacterium]